MAIEPKGKTHDSLRAYAQKRRAQCGEPFELHSAGRRLLQEEVVRTYHQPQANRGILPVFWPRLVMGGLGVAVVLAVAAIWLRSGHEQEVRLAKAEERDRMFFNAGTAANQPVPAQVPDHGLRDRVSRFQTGDAEPAVATASRAERPAKTAAKSAVDTPALQTPSDSDLNFGLTLADKPPSYDSAARKPDSFVADANRGLAVARSTPVRAYSDTAAENELLRRTQVAAEPERRLSEESLQKAGAAAPAAAVSGIDRFGGMQLATKQLTSSYAFYSKVSTNAAANPLSNQAQMQFRQRDQRRKYRQNLNSPPALNVLNSFEWQQNGPNVKIIDADGSVYAGTVLATAAASSIGGIGGGVGFGGAGGFPGDRSLTRSASPAPQAPAARPQEQLDALAQKDEASGDKLGQLEAQETVRLNVDNASLGVPFRAAGTNRTLNQVVVFTGVFEPPEGPAAAAKASNSNAGRIVGQASVGPKSQLKIEAQQAAP